MQERVVREIRTLRVMWRELETGLRTYLPVTAPVPDPTNIQPVARELGIHKKISWHTFRHTFSSILKANGEDVKVVQELLRHATSKMTLYTYTQALSPDKRAAQSKVVGMIRPKPTCTVVVPRVSEETCVSD